MTSTSLVLTSTQLRRTVPGRRVAATVSALGLAVSAVVHYRLAARYDAIGDLVTLGALFRAQAVTSGLLAAALLVRPTRSVLAAAAVVAGASALAVVLTVYVRVPAVGPLPVLYEPIWFTDKVVSAVVATVAVAAALAARPWLAGAAARGAR